MLKGVDKGFFGVEGDMKKFKKLVSFLPYWPSGMLKDLLLECRSFERCHLSGVDILIDEQMGKVMLHVFAALILMSRGKHSLARKFLANQCACDRWYACIHNFLCQEHEDSLMVLFEDVKNVGIDALLSGRLASFIADLDVTPLPEMCYKRGGYTSYYKSKREDFTIAHQAEWREKQKNVFNILSTYKPKTVLDIGANIGWFSMLAEHLGAEVVATDIDEASISTLYEYVKQDALNIMPLVLSFSELVNSDGDKALFVTDIVLSLAVVHHLVFIAGIWLEQVFKILSAVTKNTLVLEYVDINDDRMVALLTDPSVLNDHILHRKVINMFETYGKDNYTFDNFLSLGKKYFDSVQILNSHPNTRKLLVFNK